MRGFRMSQPAFSLHLRVLRSAGLVQTQKLGRYSIYSINPLALRDVARWMQTYERFWSDRRFA